MEEALDAHLKTTCMARGHMSLIDGGIGLLKDHNNVQS